VASEPLEATLLALLAAYIVCAGIDWLWQLAAVGVLGVAGLALVAASGGLPTDRDVPRARGHRLALGALALGGAWVAICAQVVPWVTNARISDSQSAARRGDLDHALEAAKDARAIQPWAATPYLQMALVAEARGDLGSAVRWIHAATRRNEDDWATWYVASRLERRAGNVAAARRDYARAKSLNIRSPLFATSSGS
jgi:tetratricopeptide (TPR) repeat protein